MGERGDAYFRYLEDALEEELARVRVTLSKLTTEDDRPSGDIARDTSPLEGIIKDAGVADVMMVGYDKSSAPEEDSLDGSEGEKEADADGGEEEEDDDCTEDEDNAAKKEAADALSQLKMEEDLRDIARGTSPLEQIIKHASIAITMMEGHYKSSVAEEDHRDGGSKVDEDEEQDAGSGEDPNEYEEDAEGEDEELEKESKEDAEEKYGVTPTKQRLQEIIDQEHSHFQCHERFEKLPLSDLKGKWNELRHRFWKFANVDGQPAHDDDSDGGDDLKLCVDVFKGDKKTQQQRSIGLCAARDFESEEVVHSQRKNAFFFQDISMWISFLRSLPNAQDACLVLESSFMKQISRPGRFIIGLVLGQGMFLQQLRREDGDDEEEEEEEDEEYNVALGNERGFDYVALWDIKEGEEIIAYRLE